MRQICTERFKKFICAMSVMLLMLGMCFRVMEADSFLSYICVTRNAATLGSKFYRKAKYGISLYD